MTDASAKSTNKKKKRKLLNLDDNSETLKKHCNDEPEKRKESSKIKAFDHPAKAALPWRNLQLILLLESKEIEYHKKVELAFEYVNSREKGVNEREDDSQSVKVYRLVGFLNDWLRPLLFPDEKETRVKLGLIEAHLDYRCWLIFKFCLEESLRLRVLLSIPKNLLTSLRLIATNALSVLTDTSLSSKDLDFIGDRFALFSVVLDCVALVFSSHGGLSNDNLDLWIETVSEVLKLVRKVFNEKLDGGNAGIFALRFCCLVLEPFAKFLRVHPARKGGFQDFVKLVEPLLYLLGVLHLHTDGRTGKLLAVGKEVLSQGLFHSVHIDGFLSLCSSEKNSLSKDGKVKDSETDMKSYHRHLFDELESVVASKKEFELSGLGELFHLLVDKVRKQRTLSNVDKIEGSKHLENSYGSSNLTGDKRKSLFDFFEQIMNPLLHEIEAGPSLMETAYFIIKSINHLLANLFHENLYIKTEDFSGGACFSFLKKVYDTVFSFSARLCSLFTHDTDGKMQEIIVLLGKELLVAIRYLIDTEYEIIGDDLSILWVMVLSYSALGHFLKDVPNHCLLTTQALGLGCELVKLYSEIRQVEKIILALSKAIRCIIIHEKDGNCEKNFGSFASFTDLIPSEAYTKSVQMLLCAHEFKLAISKGIASLPEGQVSECVKQLSNDLAESIKWMESNTRKHETLFLDVQAELFGGGLSELYTLVLDSLTVAVGNSSLLGVSMRDLTKILGNSMSILAGLQPDSVYKFLLFVAGKTSNKDPGKKRTRINFGASTHWIFVFFFRLYISCRSLCRQIITLMPPARKMSGNKFDFLAAYTGEDLIKRTEWIKEEYFSWVVQPSSTLLAVINSVSDFCGSTEGIWPLIYVFHVMAIQRLVDLNRQIKSLEYILQNESSIILEELKGEAKSLAEFITNRLSLLGADDEISSVRDFESRNWDFGVSSLNEDSGPTAIWWVLCQNVDIWSPHASKKELKKFLSLVICTCLPFISSGRIEGESYKIDEAGFLNKINVHHISYDLLTSSVFHEQDFVRRHLASEFCSLLNKSVLPPSTDLSDVNLDLKTSPDWKEILGIIGSLPMVVSGSQSVTYGWQLEGKTISPLQLESLADIPVESAGLKFSACQSLLSLLNWIPKGNMTSKSFSRYVTHLLNLERCAISNLLERRDALSLDYQYQLLRLLVSCRRTLKAVSKEFYDCENRNFQSSTIPVLSENLCAVMWLFKSVNIVFRLQDALSKDRADQVRARICSLMDHTSQIFLILSKHHFSFAFEHYASRLESLEKSIAWQLAESLKDQTEGVLKVLKDALSNEKKGKGLNIFNVESLPSIVSCLSGFLWGLASALNYKNAANTDKKKILSLIFKPDFKIKLCVNAFVELISFVFNTLFAEDNHQTYGSFDSVASILRNPDTYWCKLSSNCLLQSLVKGDNPLAGIMIRELLIASSALLRLNLQTNCTGTLSSSVPLLFNICHVLLFKFANLSEVPKLFSFLWFDGVLSYLQELWCHFPSDINSESSRSVYTSLVEMHLNALGMCISLQGKEATLASYETDSRSKILCSEEEESISLISFLDGFKVRLRMTINELLKASNFHRQSLVNVIMRALVGINDGFATIYDINTGSPNGGKVSPFVAAGIDCLDLLVEHVSGGRKLDVSENIQNVMSALFNIVIHLQSPLVYCSVKRGTIPKGPDPGAVILMSVEVLTRISGKHALFRMNSGHVALSFRIPAVIFHDFCRVRESETFSTDIVVGAHAHVDEQFSTALFGACCRLLSTSLRHHKSEAEQCIGLLQESVRVLLHCLETLNSEKTSTKHSFQMGVQEGVRCAGSLRRIYEELRQQKEDFSQHCFKFLSDYILVYSGYGPLKTGITREVDEALKPGVYALVDCCTPNDLQHLHSVYGEGPCRNTLAALQHDYKLNFQYEGKV